jgi:hypothetical protein
MTLPGERLRWSQIRDAARARQRRMAALRPGVCAIIAVPLLILAAMRPSIVTALLAVVPVLVFVAFLREAMREAREDPLVIRGRVIQRGGVWGTDSGGMVESPALRVVYTRRVTIEVREAWFVDGRGQRRPASEHVGRFETELPQWVNRVDLDEEVALLCLPRSTDPILKLDVAWLEGSGSETA